MRVIGYGAFFLVLVLSACTEDSKTSDGKVRAADPDRGKRIYLAECITCHNSDPSKNGSTAPAIKGSSEALLEARILRAAYPPGYTPKRQTKSMKPLPYLKRYIPDLAAFLADDAKKDALPKE